MILEKLWTTPAAFAWLQKILHERFGHQFTLQTAGPQTLHLGLLGASAPIELVLDSATFSRADSDLPCTEWNAAAEGWHSALRQPLPAPGVEHLPAPLIDAGPVGWRIHYDILGLAYWMLSRAEEVCRTDLDNHERFPATSSHAHKHGYLERPIVDEWLHILGQVIQRQWPGIKLKEHRFNIKVSHDVDGPSRYAFKTPKQLLRAMAGDVIRRRDFRSALQAPWIRLHSASRLHPADPANTFDWIMDVSEQHGLTSAFYFICGRTDPSKDSDYELEHPAIQELLRRIHARGHEIGLHPSYGTFQKPAEIVKEAERLRRVCAQEGVEQAEWGGRMHYLRWEHPTTLRAWEQAGMAYDSTLSYADLPGFRCGTCFEYPAFDPVENRQLSMRIRPLIAMECSIIAERYMGLGTGSQALEKFSQLMAACQAVNGCFTTLWHNTEFDKITKRNLYLAVLGGACGRGPIHGSGRRIEHIRRQASCQKENRTT